MFKLSFDQNNPNCINSLQRGDIVLKYTPTGGDVVVRVIRAAQQFKNVTKEEACNYKHAGIYLGNGMVAEATFSLEGQLIRSSIYGSHFKIPQGKKNEVHFFRLKNKEMADDIANIAEQLTIDPEVAKKKSTGDYSFLGAFNSILDGKKPLSKRIEKTLRVGLYSFYNLQPKKSGKHKDFFCSYLAAWALQGAEAFRLLNVFNNIAKHKKLPPIEIPNLLAIPEMERHSAAKKWANQIVKEHGFRLAALLEIDLDAKTTTPAELFEFMANNPHLFEPVERIYST